VAARCCEPRMGIGTREWCKGVRSMESRWGRGWLDEVGAAVGSCIDSRAGHARVGGTTGPTTAGWWRRDSGHERCRMVGAKHTPICLPPACLLAPCLPACLPARLCLYTRHPSRPSQRETLACKLVNFACTSRTRKFHGVRIQRPSSVVPFRSPSPPSVVPPLVPLLFPEQGNQPQFAGTSRSLAVLTPVLAPRSEFQTLRLDLPLPLAVLFTSRRGYAR